MQTKKKKPLYEDVSSALRDIRRFDDTVEMCREQTPDPRQVPVHLTEARNLVMKIRKALPPAAQHDIEVLWKMIQRGI